MDDLISRQAAIDALRDYLVGKRCPDDGTLTCRLIENEVVNKLPSALGTDVPDNNVGELISRQQAIDIAKELTITIEGYEMHNQAVMNYCAEIIQLPPIQPEQCEDAVSRQEVADILENADPDLYVDLFNKLPSVTPKQRTGKWVKLDMHRGMADHKCTACGQECYVPTCMGEPLYAFCPNCGSRNEVTT